MSTYAPLVVLPETATTTEIADVSSPSAAKVPESSSALVPGDDNGKSGEPATGSESDDSGMPPVMAKPNEAGNAFVLSEGAIFTYGVLGDSALNKAILVNNRNGTAVELDTQDLQNTPAEEAVQDGYRSYTVHISLEKANSNLKEHMFVVLEGLPDLAGYSLGVFTVVQDVAEVDGARNQLQTELSQDSDLEPGFTRKDSRWYIDKFNYTTSATGEVWDPTTTGSPTKGASPSNTEDSKISGSDSNDRGSGGLSDGAKAGIGAGAGVAGLILIGLLIFFFLRRRRRRAARLTDETSLTPANDFIRDKESHSARVAESPHSPASEDDRARDSAFDGGDAAERAPASPVPTTGTGSGQRDVPSAMAHLVEEGMSEADIRRLEEEERALDQAIEQAGRR